MRDKTSHWSAKVVVYIQKHNEKNHGYDYTIITTSLHNMNLLVSGHSEIDFINLVKQKYTLPELKQKIDNLTNQKQILILDHKYLRNIIEEGQ